jgi:large subunit ribosomal protein L28
MPYQCQVCGKSTTFGNAICRRGLPKAKGGVGLKTTGKTRRRFRPNLQKIRVKFPTSVRRIYVCTACLRSGRVTKAV